MESTSAQLCLTLCDHVGCRLPGSSVHGIIFSRPEYWSGLPFLPPGDLSDPEIEPASPALQVDSLPLSHLGKKNGSNKPTYRAEEFRCRE